MAKRVLNHWPSVLLTIVLFIGIVACFRRLDYLVIDEVKALISILFGFATTCLLLTYIWIIQRRPLNRSWPNQTFAFGPNVPSMHPRGRMESVGSEFEADGGNNPISIIELDKPPTYDDAIVYSKPVHQDSTQKVASQNICQKSPPNTSVTQIALNIVKNFAHIDQNNNNISDHTNQASVSGGQANGTPTTTGDSPNQRKISYVQLDVNQLALSNSPPRYSELMLGSPTGGGRVLDDNK